MRSIEILLVEDNPGDVDLTRAALRRAKVECRLTAAADGEEALSALERMSRPCAQNGLPDLILLDLNLPKLDGREVLRTIKADRRLRRIPVVVLTSSKAEDDVARSYDAHANGYVAKPLDFEQLVQAIEAIDRFWFRIARLPNQAGG